MITTCLQLAQRILWWNTVTDARVCLDLAAAGKCPPSLRSRCVSGLAAPRIPPVVPYSRLISHLAYSERQMDRNTAMLAARIDPFGLPARLMERPPGTDEKPGCVLTRCDLPPLAPRPGTQLPMSVTDR